MLQTDNKIGFFDSGVGGLSILSEFIKLFPNCAVEYYADSAHCPYGDKTTEEIQFLTIRAVEYLFSKNCGIVVLACNTATARTIRYIQQEWLPIHYPNKKVLGIIRPVSEYIVENFGNKPLHIGLMATKSTILSQFYQEELSAVGYNKIIELPASGLADAIENNNIVNIQQAISSAFLPLHYKNPINILILACTHYPFVQQFIQQELHSIYSKNIQNSNSIHILSQSSLVAEKLKMYIQHHPHYLPSQGSLICTTSGSVEHFKNQVQAILPHLENQNGYAVYHHS